MARGEKTSSKASYNSEAGDLHHQHLPVPVHYHAGEPVGLAMNHANPRRWLRLIFAQGTLAPLVRCRYALHKEGLVQGHVPGRT